MWIFLKISPITAVLRFRWRVTMKGISGIIHCVSSPSYLPLTSSPSYPPSNPSSTPISSDPSSTPISQIHDQSESPLSTLPIIPRTEIELKTGKDSLIDTQSRPVYSWQVPKPQEVQVTTIQQHGQESKPKILQSNIVPFIPQEEPQSSELDLPIALGKGTSSCTQHPLSNYLSYSRLSPAFWALIEKISTAELPSIHEALK